MTSPNPVSPRVYDPRIDQATLLDSPMTESYVRSFVEPFEAGRTPNLRGGTEVPRVSEPGGGVGVSFRNRSSHLRRHL